MRAVSHSAVTTHDMSPAIQLLSSARLYFFRFDIATQGFLGVFSSLLVHP